MAAAEKISITITPQMAAYVNEQVAKGRFASASEMLRAALRLWKKDEDEYQERLASIRARIDASVANPGRRVTLEEFREEMAEFTANYELPKKSA